jgi:hypothetical protein
MNRYEILIVGTNGEVSFTVQALSILGAWDILRTLTPQVAYVGAPLSVNIKEL